MIAQVNGKGWATAHVAKDLLNALDDVIRLQQNLCSGGCDKVIADTGAFLGKRVRESVRGAA
jgi:hypothetical protein